VLTLERVDGIPIGDRDAIVAAGHDPDVIMKKCAEAFFYQVFRDGFFHADMHGGNAFVDKAGHIVPVDFGIMGRVDEDTRGYLAELLVAFLRRDYRAVAEVQFRAGYVPQHQSLEMFAQACRSIGEPIFGRPLNEISFARLLGQLFAIAEVFDMEVQPQLLLLQKNMLMAEGVSRRLNPDLNIWTLAQPLVEEWMRENRGPEARLRNAAGEAMGVVERLPSLLADIEKIAAHLTSDGLRLHPDALAGLGRGQRANAGAWWALAAAFIALAAAFLVFLR
jgi:ubiquinone biosynthesis protein